MTTIPKSTIHPIASCIDSPEKTLFNTRQADLSRFDALFTVVFDSLRIEELAGTTYISNILTTIANITAHK